MSNTDNSCSRNSETGKYEIKDGKTGALLAETKDQILLPPGTTATTLAHAKGLAVEVEMQITTPKSPSETGSCTASVPRALNLWRPTIASGTIQPMVAPQLRR